MKNNCGKVTSQTRPVSFGLKREALRAPFPWFGGKSRVAHLVWDRFGEVRNYVEPFAGSLAVLLGRPGDPSIETVNDSCAYLSNFWRAVAADPDEVARWADWPVNECVPAGTAIATPDGPVAVEKVRVGMMVWGQHAGRIMPTLVTGTSQSTSASFVRVGPLQLTRNHPVWTAENGYVEAANLVGGMHVAILGDLQPFRSAVGGDQIHRHNVPPQAALQRASFARRERRANLPGLLDSLIRLVGLASNLFDPRGWQRRRMAGAGALLDRVASGGGAAYKPHRWRGGFTGPHSFARAAAQVVEDARRSAIQTWSEICNAWSPTLAGSSGEDSPSGNRADAQRCHASTFVGVAQGSPTYSGAPGGPGRLASRKNAHASASAEDNGGYVEQEGGSLRRERPDLSLYHCRLTCSGRDRGISKSSDPEGLPLQREPSSIPVEVFNFQTATGNYFAAGILVHNCDLHARHRWLVETAAERVEQVKTDPDFYDAKVAGWWVWGQCLWIGSGWCSRPEWTGRVNAGRNARGVVARSVPRQIPDLSGDSGVAGRGIHASGFEAKYGKRPGMTGRGGRGDGVLAERDGPGGLHDGLLVYMRSLSHRLRRVRVCCGDFERILGPAVTTCIGMTGVFLDPPYPEDGRAICYTQDGDGVWWRAYKWALENGGDPLLRIALCGYEHPEAVFPPEWDCVEWKASGGYGRSERGKSNALRERIWFSPNCLKALQNPLPFEVGS